MPKNEFFDLFRDRWKLASESEKEQRERELDDLKFEAGEHWDAKVKADREAAGKPALVIDLIGPQVKQVTNQQRTARPGIKITAVGLGATSKKAEYWQGYVRRVERLSSAGRVYSWAGQYQARMGRGLWALRPQYIGDSFDQEPRLEEIDNQHTVYFDPTAKKLDTSDKRWAIRWCDYTHEEYVARFGKSKLANAVTAKSWQTVGDSVPEWITSKHVRVAEYYYLESEDRERWLLSDGSEVWADEIPTERGRVDGKFAKVPTLPEGVEIANRRTVTRDRVRFCFLNGIGEKIEEATIPGEYIPLVRVFGERRNTDGKVDYRGLVRNAKDPNRMEDFAESSLMEAISDAKTAPWLAEWDQISEFAEMWQNSNRVNYALLPYKRQSSINGAAIPPPSRIPAGVDVSHLTLAAQRMQNHVRGVMGGDLNVNETGAEERRISGRAYNMRRQQQELGTSDYMENLGDGIVLTAKIIMSMARDMVDTPRVVSVYGEDEKTTQIVIFNSAHGQEQEIAAMRMAAEHQVESDEVFDIAGSKDDYEIAVSPGRRHDTARQESVEILSEVVPKLPPQMQMVAFPTMIRNIDAPGMAELAAKLEPETDGKPNADALMQQVQMLQQQLEGAAEIIKTDQVKQQAQIDVARMNNDTKIELERLKLQAEVAIAQMKIEAEQRRVAHEAEVTRIREQEGRESEQEEAERGRRHEAGMADRTAAHASRQIDQNADRALLQSDVDAQHATQQAQQGHEFALEEGAQQADAAMQQLKARPKPNGAGA